MGSHRSSSCYSLAMQFPYALQRLEHVLLPQSWEHFRLALPTALQPSDGAGGCKEHKFGVGGSETELTISWTEK